MNASAVFKRVGDDDPDDGDGVSMASSEGGFGRVEETTMGSSPSSVPPDASLYPLNTFRSSLGSGGASAASDYSSDDDDANDGPDAVIEELETDLTDQPQMKFLYEGWLTKLGYGSGKWVSWPTRGHL